MLRKLLGPVLAAVAWLALPGAFSGAQNRQPRTVREFFELLPQKYFALEGCAADPTEKNCDEARADYLRRYLEVEDAANGYMRGGCDGAQSCFHMALFKRPDGTYLVGLTTAFEDGENSYFLEYAGGRWRDVGRQVVPGYGEDKVYELPRYGTTVGSTSIKKSRARVTGSVGGSSTTSPGRAAGSSSKNEPPGRGRTLAFRKRRRSEIRR